MYLKLENNLHHWCLHINFSHWLSHLKAYFPYDSLKFSIISFMLWAYTKHLNLTIGVNIQNIVTTSEKKKRIFSKIVTKKIFYFLFLENDFFFSTNQMCFPLWKYKKFFFLKNKKLKTKKKKNYKKYTNIFGIINLFLLNQTGPPEAQQWFWPNLFRWRSAFTSL